MLSSARARESGHPAKGRSVTFSIWISAYAEIAAGKSIRSQSSVASAGVARMERSVIRGRRVRLIPHCASLHAGYLLTRYPSVVG
jgi:hypothetical protein